MKISKNFKLKNIAGSFAVIPVGNNVVDFSSMITTNEVGAFLWNLMLEDTTVEQMADKLCAEYDVDRKTAIADIGEYVEELKNKKVLEM